MKYFSPETSKKLKELDLERLQQNIKPESLPEGWGYDVYMGGALVTDPSWTESTWLFTTLDICEIENAKKLWGDDDVAGFQLPTQDMPMPWYQYQQVLYITLSDEERVKYVEDYLA